MSLLRQYIKAALHEKSIRGQKDKRVLYHINVRPARPQPKVTLMQQWDDQAKDRFGEEGDFVNVPGTDNWQRYWLDSPVKSGVFLTPNPADIARNHGRSGNVYAYKVPEWAIEKSGGMHRYDRGSEILIPEDVWDEAGDEIEFIGKTMSERDLWDKIDDSMYGRGHHRTATKKDPLAPDVEIGYGQSARWKAKEAPSYNIRSLRSTKHPESAIKMMKPTEVEGALAAFEKKYPQEGQAELEKGPRDKRGIVIPFFGRQPDKKDEELIAMLKKRQNESLVRDLIRENLLEAQYAGIGVQQQIGYGKNYHTVNPQPITWENYEGLSYNISAEGDGSYYASIEVLDYPEMSTPTRSFPDEGSAEWWVRDTYEKLHRFLLAKSSAK